MKKIMFIISASLLLLNISLVNAETYKNLDNIEVTGYFHTSLLVGDSCGGGAGDWRFSDGGFAGFSYYKELKDFFDNSTSISCQNVSLGTINNTAETLKYYTDVINTNKTGSGEYMLFSSKDFMSNIAKNPIFKDETNENDMKKFLQSEFFKGKQVKITGKYYHIKGKYNYTTDFTGEQSVDLDLNVVIVDDISLNEQQQTKKYILTDKDNAYLTSIENKIIKIFMNLEEANQKSLGSIYMSKLKIKQSSYSADSRQYILIQSLIDYINMMYVEGLTLEGLFDSESTSEY